jgi:riboflavin biosynthesis pyrimidine reductase
MTMRRLLPDPIDDVDLPAAYKYPAARVWLRANMVTSADGAATVDGRAGRLGSPTDQRVLGLLRALSDVVIAGAGTVIAENYGPARPRAEYQEMRAAAGQPPAPVMAVVSRRLQLDFESRYFTEASPPPIVITCEAAASDKVNAARKVADVIVAGRDNVSPALLVEALSARGHRRLLCEGGPTLLATIAADGVLDELCLTISPLLVSGPSRRILEGPPLDPPLRMRLTQLLQDDDDLVYARYEVLR